MLFSFFASCVQTVSLILVAEYLLFTAKFIILFFPGLLAPVLVYADNNISCFVCMYLLQRFFMRLLGSFCKVRFYLWAFVQISQRRTLPNLLYFWRLLIADWLCNYYWCNNYEFVYLLEQSSLLPRADNFQLHIYSINQFLPLRLRGWPCFSYVQ